MKSKYFNPQKCLWRLTLVVFITHSTYINESVYGDATGASESRSIESDNTGKSTRSFLFCLEPNVPRLTISSSNRGIRVGDLEINDFIERNGVVHLEPWLPHATENDRDGDIYLNRIYRAYISEEKRANIHSIISRM